jgi:hypothetical protein
LFSGASTATTAKQTPARQRTLHNHHLQQPLLALLRLSPAMRPSIQLHMPPKWLFKFPPDANPPALPPPTDARTFASPFPIDPTLYNDALDWKVPVTIATLYATTAIIMNKINRDRGNKPWGIAHTRAFKIFVIAHNVFLAIFSAFTFVGMIRALAHTWPGREHHLFGKFWPGLRTENGIAGAADALCKMHGPRGFGDSVYYNPITELWENKNRLISLAASGTPDTSDVGRLWNEGLAFWGWWFYLSKFYEVFDTFIILAKGKRSSTLQTYHHTGAMMCMWAGIRYMSPPIWMFAFLNSGIHAMMVSSSKFKVTKTELISHVVRVLHTLCSRRQGSSACQAHFDHYADLTVHHRHHICRSSPFRFLHHPSLDAIHR